MERAEWFAVFCLTSEVASYFFSLIGLPSLSEVKSLRLMRCDLIGLLWEMQDQLLCW